MPRTWDHPQKSHPFSIWQRFSEQLIGTKCHDRSGKVEFGKAWSRCFKSSDRGPRKTMRIVWHLVPKRSGDEQVVMAVCNCGVLEQMHEDESCENEREPQHGEAHSAPPTSRVSAVPFVLLGGQKAAGNDIDP